MNYNLLVTTFKNRESDALEELTRLLDILGDKEPSIEITSISGIILANTRLDPFQIVENCKEMVRNEPWRFRYVLRIIPLEKICRAEIIEIHSVVKRLCTKIGHHETFMVMIEKRQTKLHSKEIISTVTSDLDIKVNLDNPNWIILIQIINRLAGISILRANQIFSSVKEKISSIK
ncbi:MAG TPA: THUMP domain-containing protein [Nitrososphaeraceae archaeon]|nr:THUMP domain-containing protein [Nitrososphaeraceae archaeon]